MQHWLTLFIQQISDTSLIEWLAVAFAVAEVLLARINNKLLYPAGIISTAIFIYIMYAAHLFAESWLNVYYLVMSIYGWLHWIRKKNEPPLPITHVNTKDRIITIGIILGSWAILYYILHVYTISTVPVWDAWVSATAWAGMWLLARRKIENWLVLNLSNLFAIPLLLYKGLPLTACLTLFLFIVAIFGYLQWKKLHRTQAIQRQQHPALEH
ncbi:MAG: nicotinamide mononucleotide transporter [Taibaiella sp.]|nr:nicotinamide mononucleotide transporter [Taibaiella sp.]